MGNPIIQVNQIIDEPEKPEPQAIQKAATAFKALPMYEAEAKEKQRAAGIERASGERNESGQLIQEVEEARELKQEPPSIQKAATAFKAEAKEKQKAAGASHSGNQHTGIIKLELNQIIDEAPKPAPTCNTLLPCKGLLKKAMALYDISTALG